MQRGSIRLGVQPGSVKSGNIKSMLIKEADRCKKVVSFDWVIHCILPCNWILLPEV